MDTLNTLSERLKSAMLAKGAKAADLARITGAKPPSVHKWLTGGTKNLKGENLVKVAEFLDVSEAWLADGVPPRERKTMDIWPFQRWVPYTQVERLSETDRAYIAAGMRRSLDELLAAHAIQYQGNRINRF